jgi:large subunit ribosomal protein L21
MNFAVIKTGGKQYKVAANDVVKVEKLAGEPGDVVTFDQVLMVGNGDDVTVGAPLVAGATVAGHLVSNKKQRTVIIQKKHRRQHFDRRNGHRQILATVRIGEILIGGAKTTLTVDEKAKARYAALLSSSAPVAAPVEAPKPVAKKPPAKKAAVKAAPADEAPAADEAAAKPAKKAPAKKAAAKKTEEGDKPAAKKAPAKKAAPKSSADSADKE